MVGHNVLQRVSEDFRCLETKIANKGKPYDKNFVSKFM